MDAASSLVSENVWERQTVEVRSPRLQIPRQTKEASSTGSRVRPSDGGGLRPSFLYVYVFRHVIVYVQM